MVRVHIQAKNHRSNSILEVEFSWMSKLTRELKLHSLQFFHFFLFTPRNLTVMSLALCKYRNKLIHRVVENKVLMFRTLVLRRSNMSYYSNEGLTSVQRRTNIRKVSTLFSTTQCIKFISIFTTVFLETPTQPILVFTSLPFILGFMTVLYSIMT